MILKYLSAMWMTIAAALGNHLWQSTLFAIAAGALTLVLRKNHARARYWLWLAASVKFLIPFSLLVGIGRHLAWSHGSAGAKAGLYFAIEEVGQPFTQQTISVISRPTPSAASPNLIHLLPGLLGATWVCGFLVILFVWYVRWRQISAAVRQAVPLREGREVLALRRLESVGEMPKRIEVRLSRASLEPGIFGIASPVLIWPEGISDLLEDAHLDGILAHELCHVRRRDNLAAAVHMAVEAIFWFHPLVWWMGARLLEERERACDEEVLEMGSERRVYAESILKTCEFCVEAPRACVSGVTGADLKKRIVRIVNDPVARKRDFTRKLLLTAAGLVAAIVPVAFGLLSPTQIYAESQGQSTPAIAPSYEVASIRPNKSGDDTTRLMNSPNGSTATSITLQTLIREAYGVQDHQILGAPSWLNSEKYDVQAKMDSVVADELRKLSREQIKVERRRTLQSLLADRLKLTLHRETRELSVLALVIAKKGLKLQEAKPGDAYPNGIKGPDGQGHPNMMVQRMGMEGKSELTGQAIPMASLIEVLSSQLHRTILDKTGFAGRYDFTLEWTPEESQPNFMGTEAGQQGPDNTASPESSGPSIFAAIQEQLELKLETQKGPVEVLVIEHIEKPTEN
jgi:uncharacterized protein (TIGR03435 family)